MELNDKEKAKVGSYLKSVTVKTDYILAELKIQDIIWLPDTLEYSPIFPLKFSFYEKATQIWSYLPLDLTFTKVNFKSSGR